MGENSQISWTDCTFNPWISCTKVSPACDNCYAERWAKRYGIGWGVGVSRRRTKTWGDPTKWDRKAQLTGYRPRVFCASLADVFDNEVDQQWRDDLWALIRRTKNLRWMLLTKRIGNAAKMLPADWPYPHVGLMSTIVTQEEWDRDYHKLAALPAAWRGVSVEPMLGKIKIGTDRPNWIICGGESGPHHRTLNLSWVRDMRDQCYDSGIAFHFKQIGGVRPTSNGCALDGREYKEFPSALM
jgi:protein gp37